MLSTTFWYVVKHILALEGALMAAREHPYTLQFAMDSTGLSSQTLRHWRGVLSPLKGRSAHQPCFSAGDLLALKVLQAWVMGTGGRISQLETTAAGLFALCAEEPWPRIEQSLLAYDLEAGTWELVAEGAPIRWPNGMVLLPIGRLARDLSDRLIGNRGASIQKPLEFPLMRVSSDTAPARPKTAKGRGP